MKKYFMAAVALLMCGSAMAIENEPKEGLTYMGFLGVNAPTHITNTDLGKKPGGTFGARIDYVLPKAHGTYLTAGLDWTLKGGKNSYTTEVTAGGYTEEVDATVKACLHYIEIPVRVGFHYNLNKSLGLYGEVGPYFAFGMGGKIKTTIDADGTRYADYETSYAAFKNKSTRANFQRWDCGVGFRVGAEYNQHYNLMLGADWGITDMYRHSYRDYYYDNIAPVTNTALGSAHNFNFTIAFGYRF